MLWLKRNAGWAAAIAAAVLLAGAGAYYVFTQYSLNEELTTKLGEAKAQLDRLTTTVKPSPTPENVRAATEDVRRSREYSAQAQRLFVATPYQPLNNQTYKSLLENTLAELRRQAAGSSVEIPTNYSFSFEAQIRPMTFEPASLKPLSDQLIEVSEVCRALFKARVHKLESIRRVAVSAHDTQGATDILQGVVVATNRFTGLWAWPYEFTFECFSSELAGALEELSRAPRMTVVKNILVDTTEGSGPPPPPPGLAPPPQDPGVPLRGPGMRGPGMRGLRPPPGGGPPGAPPLRGGLTTVLEERLLRVVLLVHVIKPAR